MSDVTFVVATALRGLPELTDDPARMANPALRELKEQLAPPEPRVLRASQAQKELLVDAALLARRARKARPALKELQGLKVGPRIA